MSDFKAKADVDAVLSSVRRLVSDRDGEKTEADSQPSTDCFVLTPALRVIEEELHDPGAPGETAPRAEPSAESGSAASATITAFPAPPDAAAELPDAVESDETTHVSVEFLAMEKAWQEELARIKARRDQEAAAETASETATEAEREAPSLEERIAELEAAVGQAEEEWEPDGSEPDAMRPVHHRLFEVVDNSGPADPGAGDDGVSDALDEDENPVFIHDVSVEPDPEVETQPEPESEPEPVFSHSDRPFLLSQSLQAPADEHPDDPEPTAALEPVARTEGDLVEDDDVYLDLDGLRDMITEVVREELRGRLGETITRNVRRMVRMEIDRAIARYDPED